MSTGCFSWCRTFTQQLSKKDHEHELADSQEASPKSIQSSRAIRVTKYISASGKEILSILESATGVIPVPVLQEAIRIALKIIKLCEEASAVEQKVKELQDRVGHLMILVLTHITDRTEEDYTGAVVRAAKGMEHDIEHLLSTLGTINEDLVNIKAQNRWLTTFYKDLNMNTLDDCMNRLSIALEKFKLSNDLRDSDLLQVLDIRLKNMGSQVDGISKDMKHVVHAVDTIQQNFEDTQQTFDQVLSRVKQSATLLSSEVVRHQMPLKPEVFHGRDGLVEEIAEALVKEETSRVCLLGPGGMGKTSVALAVVESLRIQGHFSRQKCVWVPCIGATSAAALLEILYTQLQVPGDKHVTLEKIIFELSNSNGPRLLLVDNFETLWTAPGSARKAVEDVLRHLAGLTNVAILLTMRGKFPPCENSIKWQSKSIEPADEDACLRIFKDINPSSVDDPNISRLLHALGYMPFAVTLMASLGKEGQSTAAELLDAWSESGPDIISGTDPETSMNRSISLSVDSPLVRQDSNAVLLLSILAMLPEGIPKANLHWWAPTLKTSMIPSAIATLSKASLLLENKRQGTGSPVLFVVPVVQSFMQQHDRISDIIRKQVITSCCRYVLDHACRFDEPGFHTNSRALAAEDANIQSILFESSYACSVQQDDWQTLEALISFCWYRCDMKPSPDLARYAWTAANASGIKKYIAMSEWCLGRTYHLADSLDLAFEHLKSAYECFCTPGDVQWQRLGAKCGIDYVDAALFFEGTVDSVSLAREVEEKCTTVTDDLIHGRSLSCLGFALQESGQTSGALHYLHLAKEKLAKTDSALDISEACQAIGRVHVKEDKIEDAVAAMEEAWKYAEASTVPYIQADVSLDFAETLFKVDRDADAMTLLEKTLLNCTRVGNQFQVALTLDCMGYGYLRGGDYQNAHRAYSAAVEKYKISDATTWYLARCKNNVSSVELKLKDPSAVIGFNPPVVVDLGSDDVSLFYPLSATGVPTSVR